LRFVSAALRGAHRPDVIAGAALPTRLVDQPQVFAVDKLVPAVPAGGKRRVRRTLLPAQARAFIHGLRRGAGRDALIDAGLTPR